ncbi:MAG: hypothetical protein WBF52_09840 [Geitlerinemataceae cyanobacterium]
MRLGFKPQADLEIAQKRYKMSVESNFEGFDGVREKRLGNIWQFL